jgi:lipid-binding SYLF domain-containing protein
VRKSSTVVYKKIPTHIIQQAEGLAIFTVFRSGVGVGQGAASGSGVVISRDSPTTWGAPSGILIHTLSLGLLAGIDVYDAVLILRTQKAVMSFAKPKVRSLPLPIDFFFLIGIPHLFSP